MIRIRLAKGGRTHRPTYFIVAADARSPRNGRFLEKLGNYDPQAHDEGKVLFNLKEEKIKSWVANGAQLSDTVRTILRKHKVAYR